MDAEPIYEEEDEKVKLLDMLEELLQELLDLTRKLRRLM